MQLQIVVLLKQGLGCMCGMTYTSSQPTVMGARRA